MASSDLPEPELEESSGSEDDQAKPQEAAAEDSGDEGEETPTPDSPTLTSVPSEAKRSLPDEPMHVPPPPAPTGRRGAPKKEGPRCTWLMASGARKGQSCVNLAKVGPLCAQHSKTVAGRALLEQGGGSTATAGEPTPSVAVQPKRVKPVKAAKLERTFQSWGSEDNEGITMSPSDFMSIFTDINASKATMAARGPAKARKPPAEKPEAKKSKAAKQNLPLFTEEEPETHKPKKEKKADVKEETPKKATAPKEEAPKAEPVRVARFVR